MTEQSEVVQTSLVVHAMQWTGDNFDDIRKWLMTLPLTRHRVVYMAEKDVLRVGATDNIFGEAIAKGGWVVASLFDIVLVNDEQWKVFTQVASTAP